MVAFAENEILRGGSGYNADAETQNYYVRNRYYAAHLGRWLTRDPIGYQGGINLYDYVQSSPVGNVDAEGLDRCQMNASHALNQALSNARNQFLDDVSQDEIQGTQAALDENSAGQLDDMTDTAVVGTVGGVAGDLFKGISAISEAQRTVQALGDFREVGPLFDSAFQDAVGGKTISGFMGAMDGPSVGAIAVSAAASALASGAIFGNQGKVLSAAFDKAFAGTLNKAAPGLGTAYDVLSAIDGALKAAYDGAGSLSQYITPMTRELYAARVANALQNYASALARCRRGCGSKN